MAGVAAFERLRMLTAMHYVARCVHVAAELRIADAIAADPVPIGAVAESVGVPEDTLERMLRVLAAYGMFELESGCVSHTDMSRLLRCDHPASLRDFVRMIALRVNWRAAESLQSAIESGDSAMRTHVPEGVWAHYAAHPEDARIFDAAMSSRASLMVPAIRRAVDFRRFRRVVDVGGGRGHLLAGLLEDSPDTIGVLFDLPHVIAAAKETHRHPRLEFCAGDFFTDRLPDGDAYILMEVVHDWPDAEALQIVSAIRREARKGAHLLLMEIVPPDAPEPVWATTLDIVMLAHFGGKQRRREAYLDMLRGNAFDLLREIDTGAGISIFEAVAR